MKTKVTGTKMNQAQIKYVTKRVTEVGESKLQALYSKKSNAVHDDVARRKALPEVTPEEFLRVASKLKLKPEPTGNPCLPKDKWCNQTNRYVPEDHMALGMVLRIPLDIAAKHKLYTPSREREISAAFQKREDNLRAELNRVLDAIMLSDLESVLEKIEKFEQATF